MSNEHEIKERFVRDIQNHKMEVLLDNGLYRHLKFSDGTVNMAFNIITVPGRLWYCGDMGSYTFCRLDDMFEFFRSRNPDELQVNPSYWGQKLESYDRDGFEEYSQEQTKDLVLEHCANNEWPQEAIDALIEEVGFTDDPSGVIVQLGEFEYEFEGNDEREKETFTLGDECYEFICQDYTFRYSWCCYALVWGIQQYDKYKGQEVVR